MLRFGRGILERAGVSDQLERIGVSTLVIVGQEDVPTPVRRAPTATESSPGTRFVTGKARGRYHRGEFSAAADS